MSLAIALATRVLKLPCTPPLVLERGLPQPNFTLWLDANSCQGAAGSRPPAEAGLKCPTVPPAEYCGGEQRRGKTLLITEEDYIDTDEVPPGGCRGQGKFETWDLSRLNKGAITPLGTWETELNGMRIAASRS